MLTISEKMGTEHDEDPSHKILKILDMGSISSRKHEIDVFVHDWFRLVN